MAKDLGLLAMDVATAVTSESAVLGVPKQGEPSKAPVEKAPSKFQLGETLPVVPARIVCHILKGDFVDMVELVGDNLELEVQCSVEGEDTKPLPVHKLRPVADLLGWTKAFCQFESIVVVQAHPSKVVDMWAYLAVIRFRQQIPSLEKAVFERLDQALFTRCLLSSKAGAIQKPTQGLSTDSGLVPKAKRLRVTACFTWNDSRPCAAIPCCFQHVFSRCGGEHKKSACPLEEGRGKNN